MCACNSFKTLKKHRSPFVIKHDRVYVDRCTLNTRSRARAPLRRTLPFFHIRLLRAYTLSPPYTTRTG